MNPLLEKQKKFQEMIDSGPMSRKEFTLSFGHITKLINMAVVAIHSRLDRHIADHNKKHEALVNQVSGIIKGKDGYTPVKGKDYFDGQHGITPVPGVHFPIPQDGKDGLPGKPADEEKVTAKVTQKMLPHVKNMVKKHIAEFVAGDVIDKRVTDIVSKHVYSGGGSANFAVLQSGTLKQQTANSLNFKGTGAPTITVDSHGITQLDFPGSAGTQVYDEVVSGNTNTFTLAHTPISSVRVYGLGQRLVPSTDWTIVGKIITTVATWSTGQIVADYSY